MTTDGQMDLPLSYEDRLQRVEKVLEQLLVYLTRTDLGIIGKGMLDELRGGKE